MTKQRVPPASVRLKQIKAAHTAIWAFFAACIFAIPVVSWLAHFQAAAWLAAIVCVEIVVLLLNGWSCPMTAVAARHTTQRQANFDIYLPEWLARNNKSIFGALYLAGVSFAVIQWVRAGA
jgi:hypothetical protein